MIDLFLNYFECIQYNSLILECDIFNEFNILNSRNYMHHA